MPTTVFVSAGAFTTRTCGWQNSVNVWRSVNARILYLSAGLTINGRGAIAGRDFVGQLRSESVPLLMCHQVVSAQVMARADARIRPDLVTLDEVEVFAPTCVFAESGLLAAGDHELRVPLEWLVNFVRGGGVMIVEGLGRDRMNHLAASDAVLAQQELTKFMLSDGSNGGTPNMPYLMDLQSNTGNPSHIVCRPVEIRFSDWLAPTFDGIDKVVVGEALPLAPAFEVLASTESTATELVLDRFTESPPPFVWAKTMQNGLGHIAVLAGHVVHDFFVQSNPDNARWLSNVINHLSDEARREGFLRGTTASISSKTSLPSDPTLIAAPQKENSSLSHLPTSVLVTLEESHHLEFKESARIDVRTGQVSKEMELEVLRTIAAFLNTDGGVLLIGVSDQKVVKGIGRDLKTLGQRPNSDGFSSWLTSKLSDLLGAVAAAHSKIRFDSIDDRVICRVDVSPIATPTYVKTSGGEEFYIRANNTSRKLGLIEALEYLRLRGAF